MDDQSTQLPGGAESTELDVERELREALAPNYVLVRHLASGGMGSVYLARDPALRRSVAVKVLAPEMAEHEEARARFSREAQAIAAISHPNVISVFSVGALGSGLPYFVMEYIEGGSFADRVGEEGPLPSAEARRVIGQVASALAAAHERGLVHRDIKASNVLQDLESGRALVTDWGIAGIDPSAELEPDMRLTRTGAVMGSPKYMSPEQLAGEPVTPESDVYSLGLMAFDLLTGDTPFQASTPKAMMVAHLREDPPNLAELRDDVDPELAAMVARCLAKDTEDRPTAEEVARRFAPGAEAILEWPPPGLEKLRAETARTVLSLWITVALASASGFLLFAAPSLGLIGLDVGFVAGVMLGFATLVFLLVPLANLWTTAQLLRSAVRLGYGWGTLLDVMADRRGDTGQLLTGRLEYAGLSIPERGWLQRTRRWDIVLTLTALTLMFPTVVLIWRVGSDGVFGFLTLLLLLAPVAGALLALQALRLAERAKLHDPRRRLSRRRTPAATQANLVEPWHDGLELVSGPGMPGVGLRSGSLLGMAAAALTAGLLLFTALVVLPAVLTSAIGGTFVSTSSYVDFQTRWERAKSFEATVLPPDTSITVAEASLLVEALIGPDEEGQFPGLTDLPELPPWRPPDSLARADSFPTPAEITSSLTTSASSLSRSKAELILAATTHPVFDAFSTVARAPGLDLYQARWPAGVPDTVSRFRFRWPDTFGPLANWKLQRAAAHLALDRPEAAELELQEIVSVGFLLMDAAVYLGGERPGAVLVNTAGNVLLDLYDNTGRGTEADSVRVRRLVATEGSTVPADGRGIGWNRAAILDWTMEVLEHPDATPAVRWEAARDLRFLATCSSFTGVLFGPGENAEEALAEARRALVERPGDEIMWEWFAGHFTKSRMTSGDLFSRLIRLSGRVLDNPRLEGCLSWAF